MMYLGKMVELADRGSDRLCGGYRRALCCRLSEHKAFVACVWRAGFDVAGTGARVSVSVPEGMTRNVLSELWS